ncbi:MAG: hypothetical protein M0002_09320 [Rhodospirillales bacterium]|nr:hypothetical protein [Rhodospirillales bacterium]
MRPAVKQRDAEKGLERLDLLADRSGRNAELGRGGGEALPAGCGPERAQAAERRQLSGHEHQFRYCSRGQDNSFAFAKASRNAGAMGGWLQSA